MELQTQTQTARGFAPIALNHLRSINATGEAGDLSTRYSFIPTSRVIDVFRDHGFLPVAASEVSARKDEHVGFQKHLIRFRQSGAGLMVGDCFPEIVLTNSHNGLSSFRLMSGLFRLKCYNGLIAAEGEQEKLTIRHTGYTDDQVSAAITYLMTFLPSLDKKVETFRSIEMTPDEQGVYAQAALSVRYDEETLKAKRFNVAELLQPLRREDGEPTLWNTFNTIQEKMIKGRGLHSSKVEDINRAAERTNEFEARYGYRPRYNRVKQTKARGINAISENVRINTALWILMEKMSELKKGIIFPAALAVA